MKDELPDYADFVVGAIVISEIVIFVWATFTIPLIAISILAIEFGPHMVLRALGRKGFYLVEKDDFKIRLKFLSFAEALEKDAPTPPTKK